MTKQSLPICVCVTRDGSRCGRRVSDGSNPPVCHIHKAQQQGKAVNALVEPTPFDPQAKLLKIAANDKHQHQLAAIKLLRDRAECPTCAARAEATVEFDALWAAMTDDEKERFKALFAEHKQIRGAVQTRIAQRGQQ